MRALILIGIILACSMAHAGKSFKGMSSSQLPRVKVTSTTSSTALGVVAGATLGVVAGTALSGGSSANTQESSKTATVLMPSLPTTSILVCEKYIPIEGHCKVPSFNFSFSALEFSAVRSRADEYVFRQDCYSRFSAMTGVEVSFGTQVQVTRKENMLFCIGKVSNLPAIDYVRKAGYLKIEKLGVMLDGSVQYLILEVSK